MIFKIRYFNGNKLLGETPWTGTLKVASKVATDGLKVHLADSARILDERGKEVALVGR
jgi:hypothetical protein